MLSIRDILGAAAHTVGASSSIIEFTGIKGSGCPHHIAAEVARRTDTNGYELAEVSSIICVHAVIFELVRADL